MSKFHKQIIRKPYTASRTMTLVLDPDTGRPASLDPVSRSVEFIGATEEPAWVCDWERWEMVRESLLMSGCRWPASGQVPLLDTHDRSTIDKQLGSYRGCRIEPNGRTGPELAGRAHFDSTGKGNDAFTKVEEGHLTDCSVGYEVASYIWVDEGETFTYEGKTFQGPIRIATEWNLKELSLCPIGADENAKVRAQGPGRAHTSESDPRPLKGAKTLKPAAVQGNAGRNSKETAMSKLKVSGGKKSAKQTRGLVALLRSLLGLKREEEEEDKLGEQREVSPEDEIGVAIVDEDTGEEVSLEELTADQLEEVIDGLMVDLEEAETELPLAEEEESAEEGERKSSRSRGKKTGRRALSSVQAVQVERARAEAIGNLARAHNLSPEMEKEFIRSGISLPAAKAKVLDMKTNQPRNGGFTVSMGRTEGQKISMAMQDTLLLRCGLPIYAGDTNERGFWSTPQAQRQLRNPSPGAEEFMALPLAMLCRELLLRNGERIPGDIREIVGRALVATDLPLFLVETSRRVLMDAFEKAPETWALWCQTGTAVDFKKSQAAGLEADLKPKRKSEHAEYEEGRLSENSEEWFIEEYGRVLHISRRALINDDLDALTAVPRECGEQTAELVGDVAYAALLSNPPMGDKKLLFSAAHGNIYTGGGGVPTVEKIDPVVAGMKNQKNSFGKKITVLPRYFIAPVAIEGSSERFFGSEMGDRGVIGTQANPLVYNQYTGSYFTRVYDRRLDEVSPSDWYLAGMNNTVKVSFLGGVQSPYVESADDFDRDGVKTKVRMDVGAKAMRWATLAKSTAK